MNKKRPIGVNVTPEYLDEIDTIIDYFQSRLDGVGKVSRAEIVLKALDMYKGYVTSTPPYQVYLANQKD